MDERDVTNDARLDQVLASIDNAVFLGITWDSHAGLESALIVLDRNTAGLDERVRTRWRQKGRNAGGMRDDSLAKRSLRHELETNASSQVF